MVNAVELVLNVTIVSAGYTYCVHCSVLIPKRQDSSTINILVALCVMTSCLKDHNTYNVCSHSVDYVLISHFILHLQDISNATIVGNYPSCPSFVRSADQEGLASTVQFANSTIGDFGAPLRGTLEDEDENMSPAAQSDEVSLVC